MNIEEIDKWLDNEYGVSYTRLEELHDFVVEQDLKHREEKDREIDRLNNIINELEKTLKEEVKELYNEENPMLLDETYIKYATERKMAYMYILDKLKELKENNNV